MTSKLVKTKSLKSYNVTNFLFNILDYTLIIS